MICPDEKSINRFSFESFKLPGKHNLENLLAIVLVAQTLGIDPAVIQKNIDENEIDVIVAKNEGNPEILLGINKMIILGLIQFMKGP